jgi:hypothetical protein
MDSTQFYRMYLGVLEPSWDVMAQGDAWERKWRSNWQKAWVASTLHTTSELGVSSITTTDAHTSAASSWLNWHPCRFKWTRLFRRKTKSGFRTCAITFQTQSTTLVFTVLWIFWNAHLDKPAHNFREQLSLYQECFYFYVLLLKTLNGTKWILFLYTNG